MTLLLAVRALVFILQMINLCLLTKTVFEPKTSVGATHMTSPIYSGSDVALDRSSKAMNDELLVLAAKSGDTAAFVELRRRHAPKLLRTIYRVTRNWEDAEDALQDSFLKAYLHLNKFENRSTFASGSPGSRSIRLS
jgi:Sigma-70 region 2